MEWIQIDVDTINPEGFHRYIQEISPHYFRIIEHDTDFYNGPQMYYGYSTFVDINDYSDEQILENVTLCGYVGRQNPQIEAACIAYQSPRLDVFANTFAEIVEWKSKKGVVHQEVTD